jgi:heptosyltransferase-2
VNVTSLFPSFLIIQTAFIGDVILATALVEKLRKHYPDSSIDFLLRKGNEALLIDNPNIREVIVWDKKKGKIKNLFKLTAYVRSKKYDGVINAHRFASSGLITAFSGAKLKSGFDKNPWSFMFTHRVKHDLESNLHETERNQLLIEFITDKTSAMPALYPRLSDFEKIKSLQGERYVCIAPTSVWFTKQFPAQQWIDFLDLINDKVDHVYLLGASTDQATCESIKAQTKNQQVKNLAGHLSFLESAALMKGAVMNFVNDSAPMHMASSMNAPVTAVFCSTVPSFGFGPLSEKSIIIQTTDKLTCRPCGLHGYKKCPQDHFKCATSISVQTMVDCLDR